MTVTVSIEKLREKSYKQLAKRFKIPYYETSLVKWGLEPNLYPVITDHSLSTDEMVDKTGLVKNSIYSLRTALIRAGLDERRSPSQDKILSFLSCNPSTYEEIARHTGKNSSQLYNTINDLRKEDKIKSINIEFGRKDSKFSSRRLVGEVACRSIVYLPGEENWLGLKVAEFIPEELTQGMKSSLTHRLERILPPEAFRITYKLYA